MSTSIDVHNLHLQPEQARVLSNTVPDEKGPQGSASSGDCYPSSAGHGVGLADLWGFIAKGKTPANTPFAAPQEADDADDRGKDEPLIELNKQPREQQHRYQMSTSAFPRLHHHLARHDQQSSISIDGAAARIDIDEIFKRQERESVLSDTVSDEKDSEGLEGSGGWEPAVDLFGLFSMADTPANTPFAALQEDEANWDGDGEDQPLIRQIQSGPSEQTRFKLASEVSHLNSLNANAPAVPAAARPAAAMTGPSAHWDNDVEPDGDDSTSSLLGAGLNVAKNPSLPSLPVLGRAYSEFSGLLNLKKTNPSMSVAATGATRVHVREQTVSASTISADKASNEIFAAAGTKRRDANSEVGVDAKVRYILVCLHPAANVRFC